ncbi:MAG: hypothetical protein Q7I97_06500 [Thermovirgaceae bacterium]|nr:hypothetical protein [Thermovirgaceae bacterium]
MGTFMIFFFLFLMGVCWWIGLAYDRIFRAVRECNALRGEIESARRASSSGADGHPESIARLAEAYDAASEEANHQICSTLSGRIVARFFNFCAPEALEE